MRALVTGGTGFVGGAVARRLAADGHEVWITGAPSEQEPPVPPDRVLPRDVTTIPWDRLGTLDSVFHQAANNDTTELKREVMFRDNVEASRALFAAALAAGCRRIVYASSTAVYGDLPAPHREGGPVKPLNVYAESKVALEALAADLAERHPEVTFVGLRYCNVYGPGEAHKGKRASMIWQLAQQMLRGSPRLFQWGEQKRDYVFIDDVIRANLLAADVRASTVVNCASGTATTFNALVAMLHEVLGLRRTVDYIENPHVGRYQGHTECDLTRARAQLGFAPTVGIQEGIRRYAASGALGTAALRAAASSATLARAV